MGFSAYLQATIANYEKQRDRYTLTDLQVEHREKEERSPDGSKRQPKKQIERLEVLAGLRKYVQKGHVLLVGKPGSGKSTALQRLRWELAQAALGDEQQPIPVLVALRGDRPILDILCAEFRRIGEPIKPEEIDELLRAGRLFLLLDGLNEIPSQEREQQIDQFRQDNPRTPMIFTSRELGTGLGLEQKLEMCGLTERQMRSFVQNYLPDYAEVLLHQLKDRLRELAETPLLLKLLCDVFDPVTQQLPQSKGELFRAVDTKFNTWKQREGVRTAEKFWQWNSEILRYLAFVMLQADGTPTGKWLQIERSYAEHLLEEFLQNRVTAPGEKAKDWLQDLLEHHLLQLAAKPNQIEFHHQLFQEYYAAEYLLRQLPNLSDAKLKRDYLNYLKWTEPVALMLSLVDDKAQTVKVVKMALAVDLRLGVSLTGEVKQAFQASTVSLIHQQSSAELPDWLLVDLLAQSNSEAAIPRFLRAIGASDWDVGMSAASALGNIGSEAAIPDLFKAIVRSYWGVPSSAVEALDNIGSEAMIPVLLKAIKDSRAYVRERAVEALGNIGSEAAIPGLLKAIEHSDWDVRRRAVGALGKIGSKAAIQGLLKAMKHLDKGVRWSAVGALGRLKDDRAAHILPNLLALIPTESGQEALEAITAIQANCQFYDYKIFCSEPEPVPSAPIDLLTKIDQTTQDINQRTKQMAEQPSISISTISGGIRNFTPNQGTQTNTNIGTQHNYFGADDDLKQQIADLNQFIAELEAKHPQVQTETAANDIIDAEIVAVQTTDINRWQTLRQQMLLLKRQFLNPERQLQALKAGLGEAAKHYLEDSVWAKAILTYIDKLSETPDQGA